MSDQIVQSSHTSDQTAGPSVHPHKAVWMAHWMHTSQVQHDHDTNHNLCDPERAAKISKISKASRPGTEAIKFKIMDESLITSSEQLRKERLEHQPFPMFSLCQKKESILALKEGQNTICHREELRSQIDPVSEYNAASLGRMGSHFPLMFAQGPSETENALEKKSNFYHEHSSQSPEQCTESSISRRKNKRAFSASFRDDLIGSTSKVVPFGGDDGGAPMQLFTSRRGGINQSSFGLVSEEHHYNDSGFPICEKNMSSMLNSSRPETSIMRQKNAALSLPGPSTSENQFQFLLGKQCQKMQNHSGIGLFPDQSTLAHSSKSEKLCHGYYSVPRLPHSVHDVETMRICTTVESIHEISRGPPKFSQRTRHFLMAEKNDVSLSEGGQLFNESTTSAKFEGKVFDALLKFTPDFDYHGQEQVKLQALERSTDSEGKEDLGNIKTPSVGLEYESSAETDTMDMAAFQQNHLSGLALFPTKKGGESSQPSQIAVASGREEIGRRLQCTVLPDINEEVPPLQAVASSIKDRETSSSRTQSLDAIHLLTHAEHPTNSKSVGSPGDPMAPEASSRWVKRLKITDSDSFAGTKSTKLGETCHHDKVNQFFRKFMNGSITGLEPRMDKCHSIEEMALDQNEVSSRKGESSSNDVVTKVADTALSHSWIRRWCHNRIATPQTKPETVVVCEPQSSKATFDEFQKKQFPSIAAMALMGKAINGFRQCEFRKRGSLVVWNT